MSLRSVLRDLLRSGPGKAGTALLLLLVIGSIYVLITFPLDFGSRQWSNPSFWADNPKAKPPVWTRFFTPRKEAPHRVLEAEEPTQVSQTGEQAVWLYRLRLKRTADEPPTFLAFTLSNVAFQTRPPIIAVSMVRPDGKELLLNLQVVRGPRPGEAPPYTRYQDTPLRVLLSADPAVEVAASSFLQREFGISMAPRELRGQVERVAFGEPTGDSLETFRALQGVYEVRVRATMSHPRDSIGAIRFVAGGSVFGLMGTDSVGRDLTRGLLFGLPVALFIGVAAALLTTLAGASLGVISGYMGGWTDTAIQRLADIVANVPVLPLLIFLTFILGANLFVIIGILVAFSWPGLTILIRSMVLQLRTGQLVEASVALGASRTRIMVRHIFPQTAPFVFGQMIFFTPAAILAEAALSFLGLGDPSIPTWGQILEQGFRTGGVYVGYWWWVVPPGLLIVITAITFMLLALGMEPVVNPRLRRRA